MGRRSSSKQRRTAFAENVNAVPESVPRTRSSRVASIADASLKVLAQQTMAGLNASAVAIAIDADGEITCRARSGRIAPEIGTPVQRDRGLTGECLRTGAMVRCDDALNDPRLDSGVYEQLQIGSILIAPLLRNGQAAGVVEAFTPLPNSFDDVDVEFLAQMAQEIVTRVWPEEASAQSVSMEQPADVAIDETGGQASSLAATKNDEPAFVETTADELTDTALSESQSDDTAPSDLAPAPLSRTRPIAIAIAALIVIVIVALLYTNSHKRTVPQSATPTTKQSAHPAAPEPLAELRRAAEAGDATAQYKLARAYKTGAAVQADPQLANAWLRTAAEHGSADAQLDWARAHEKSEPVEAYSWYVIAGQNGNSESDDAIRRLAPKLTPAEIAQVRLEIGRQYLAGHALPRDPVAAYVWFRLSEWGGNTTASTEMQHVESQLTPKQLRQAETRAAEWIRRHTAPAAPRENADVQR